MEVSQPKPLHSNTSLALLTSLSEKSISEIISAVKLFVVLLFVLVIVIVILKFIQRRREDDLTMKMNSDRMNESLADSSVVSDEKEVESKSISEFREFLKRMRTGNEKNRQYKWLWFLVVSVELVRVIIGLIA